LRNEPNRGLGLKSFQDPHAALRLRGATTRFGSGPLITRGASGRQHQISITAGGKAPRRSGGTAILLMRHSRGSSSFAPHARGKRSRPKQILTSRRFSPRQLTAIISGFSQGFEDSNAVSISSTESDFVESEAGRLSGTFTRS